MPTSPAGALTMLEEGASWPEVTPAGWNRAFPPLPLPGPELDHRVTAVPRGLLSRLAACLPSWEAWLGDQNAGPCNRHKSKVKAEGRVGPSWDTGCDRAELTAQVPGPLEVSLGLRRSGRVDGRQPPAPLCPFSPSPPPSPAPILASSWFRFNAKCQI